LKPSNTIITLLEPAFPKVLPMQMVGRRSFCGFTCEVAGAAVFPFWMCSGGDLYIR
jgi:hypothetical protein